MEFPLVSVVIPCYNHENFVKDCIQSVIDQTYQNIELIIIDDGSSDTSVAKIQEMIELCHKRFTNFEFRNRPNTGLSATLNEAIEWCQGEYYSVIASDDMVLPEKIEIQIQYLIENLQCVGVFGGVELIDSNNNLLEKIMIEKKKSYNFENIILNNYFLLAPTQMLRIQAIKKVGGYKPELAIEDWYMWLKLSEIGELTCLPIIFSRYRQHTNNSIKQLKKMHLGRIQVLSFFNNSPFYQKALKEIQWINLSAIYVSENKDRLKILLQLFIANPFRLISIILKKIYNRV